MTVEAELIVELTDSTDEDDIVDSMDRDDPSSEQKEASDTSLSAKGEWRWKRGVILIFKSIRPKADISTVLKSTRLGL